MKLYFGTPSYAFPEMHKGEKYDSELPDVWSCVILLYDICLITF